MKRFIRIAFLAFIIIFGCMAAISEFGGNKFSLFSNYKYLGVFLFLCFAIPAFIFERDDYRKNKKLSTFGVTLVAGVFFAIIISQYVKRAIIERTTNEILLVSLPNKRYKDKMELKKGHSFKWTVFSASEMVVYYGKYNKIGDTIIIKRSNYDGPKTTIPKKGFLKNDTLFWSNADTMLLQH